MAHKAILRDETVKWFLEHPKVHEVAGKVKNIEEFDTEMQSLLLHMIGQPLVGKITAKSPNWPDTYKVEFKTPFGKWWAWFERKDFVEVRSKI